MARPKSNGPYAPLSATYFRDDAILEVGEEAELMFVRCLAFLADAASDGFITERQMLIVVGMGLERVPERVAALVDVGLLEVVDGGYLIRSWLKWNKSTDEIGKHLKRDRERKSRTREKESSGVPAGIQADSAPQYTSKQVTTKQVTTNTPASAPADLDKLFDYAWGYWPKKVDRKDALAKFKIAAREFDGRESELVESIRAHGEAHAQYTKKQFIPGLAVWLNKERWNNPEPEPPEGQKQPTTKADQNAAAYYEIYGGDDHAGEGSVSAIDARVGA